MSGSLAHKSTHDVDDARPKRRASILNFSIGHDYYDPAKWKAWGLDDAEEPYYHRIGQFTKGYLQHGKYVMYSDAGLSSLQRAEEAKVREQQRKLERVKRQSEIMKRKLAEKHCKALSATDDSADPQWMKKQRSFDDRRKSDSAVTQGRQNLRRVASHYQAREVSRIRSSIKPPGARALSARPSTGGTDASKDSSVVSVEPQLLDIDFKTLRRPQLMRYNSAALVLQSVIKGVVQRRQFKLIRASVKLIQAAGRARIRANAMGVIRPWLVRRVQIHRAKALANELRAIRDKEREELRVQMNTLAATTILSAARGCLARRRVRQLRVEADHDKLWQARKAGIRKSIQRITAFTENPELLRWAESELAVPHPSLVRAARGGQLPHLPAREKVPAKLVEELRSTKPPDFTAALFDGTMTKTRRSMSTTSTTSYNRSVVTDSPCSNVHHSNQETEGAELKAVEPKAGTVSVEIEVETGLAAAPLQAKQPTITITAAILNAVKSPSFGSPSRRHQSPLASMRRTPLLSPGGTARRLF